MPASSVKTFTFATLLGLGAWACGGADTPSNGSASMSGGDAGAPATAGTSSSPAGATGAGQAGAIPNGGAAAPGGSAGAPVGGAGSASGGAAPTGNGCTVGPWPAADPTLTGPFKTVTENDVGPEAGAAEDDGTVPKFTLFRPENLADGLCHPVITWGNGTGSTPNLYRSLLGHLASHGFVIIASNNKNVAQGNPRPMVVGVTWVLEQNEDPASVLYHHLDVSHIGATGHSQGAVATSQAAGDSHITTNVPIEGAQVQRNLHGPAMLFCGGQDTVVGCNGAQSAFDAESTWPMLYAEYLSVDHGSWLGRAGRPSVVESTVTAWMRVHLMNDESLEPWFYGPTCKLCADAGWKIQQKKLEL